MSGRGSDPIKKISPIWRDPMPVDIRFDPRYTDAKGNMIPIKVYAQGMRGIIDDPLRQISEWVGTEEDE